jgi:hypothetical protein
LIHFDLFAFSPEGVSFISQYASFAVLSLLRHFVKLVMSNQLRYEMCISFGIPVEADCLAILAHLLFVFVAVEFYPTDERRHGEPREPGPELRISKPDSHLPE